MGKLETISEDDAAKNFDLYLDRVIHNGDRFHIVMASGFKAYLGPSEESVTSAGPVAEPEGSTAA